MSGRRRDLRPDERQLWSRVARSVSRSRKTETATMEELVGHDRLKSTNARAKHSVHIQPGAPSTPTIKPEGAARSREIKSVAPKVTVLGAGDPKMDRLAAKRRLQIERTLDLHGMTQLVARPAFLNFLHAAHRDGCRCVLVITGKGPPSERAEARNEGLYQSPRGVLRRRIVDWADDGQVRGLISRMSPARQKDGGSGAFYIFLKRKNGA